MKRLAPIVLVAVLVACQTYIQEQEPRLTQGPTPNCQSADPGLVAAIQDGITTDGAKLTKASVVPAGTARSGPPIVTSTRFADAVLVGGIISGGGVLDEPAVWIVERNDAADPGLILAVSAAAKRYSDWGADATDQIITDGLSDAMDCAGR